MIYSNKNLILNLFFQRFKSVPTVQEEMNVDFLSTNTGDDNAIITEKETPMEEETSTHEQLPTETNILTSN